MMQMVTHINLCLMNKIAKIIKLKCGCNNLRCKMKTTSIKEAPAKYPFTLDTLITAKRYINRTPVITLSSSISSQATTRVRLG